MAGGIILFGIGLGMLNSKSGESSKADIHKASIVEGQQLSSPAVVPLGIPISAGPGVITALLVSSHSNVGGVGGLIAFSLVCVALSGLMGLVVAAIASQMVLDGLRTAFPVLAGRG